MSPPPNNSAVLVFRNRFDPATEWTHELGAKVITSFHNAGFEVHDYSGADATPENFRAAVLTLNPLVILGFDHGCECDLYGELNGELVPILGVHNAELTRGRVVVTLACSTAAVLGRACVERRGCKTYIGYEVKYGFYTIPPYTDGFEVCALRVFTGLARGESAAEALKAAESLRWQYINQSENEPQDLISPLVAAQMRRNLSCHVVLGDDSVRLVS